MPSERIRKIFSGLLSKMASKLIIHQNYADFFITHGLARNFEEINDFCLTLKITTI